VVGFKNEFLTEYLGADWPCFVEPDSGDEGWLSAIERASARPEDLGIGALVATSESVAASSWSEAVQSELGKRTTLT